MHPPKIGFVTCVHPIYDLPAVARRRDDAVAALREAGCEVAVAPTPKTSLDAVEIARSLRAGDADLVLLFFCTWVGEEITLALARETEDMPLGMWALPYLDKDIPMPSPMSGITASASNIRRMGRGFVHAIGPVRRDVVDRVADFARVAGATRALRRARFGLFGRPCPGMVDVSADEADIQRLLGPATIHLELDALLRAAGAAPLDEATRLAESMAGRVGGMEGVSKGDLAENLRVYLGMRALVEQHRLDGFAVRCWPELRDQYRQTVCLTHSLMAEHGIASACEIDLPALITTYLLTRVSGSPAYSFDVTAWFEDEDAVQLAHCGSACLSLACDPSRASIRRHMRTGAGVMLEFPFRPGVVTMAKLVRPLRDRIRLFVAKGEALPANGDVRGSVASIRPDGSSAAFLDAMLEEGVEHHIVVAYGDWTRSLSTFCRFAGIDEICRAGR